MKRFISLLLCAMMLLSAFSFTVSADEVYEGLPFADVKEGAWYYEGIAFCYDMGIVSGMTDTTFVPNGTLTRAQFVQILAMVDGVDLTEYKEKNSGFVDVKPDHWFNAPVCWAVEQGFVAGLSADRFGPNEKITREQLARLLYLYAEAQGCDVSVLADLSGYTDKPSDWAYEQVQWAVGAGIISGMDETTLAPRASATRAQACRMIMSFYDFLWYGNRDTSGAFAAIVEYIKANAADTSDPNYYGVYEEYDGYFVALEYYANTEELSIAYLADPYTFTEQGTEYTGYREGGSIYAVTLASRYNYSYYRESENGEDYMNTFGTLSIDSYYEEYAGTSGFTAEELAAATEKSIAVIRERIAMILAEADMTLEDFFLPEVKNDVFTDLAALIMANSDTDGSDGWYKYGCASYDDNSGGFGFSLTDSVLEHPGMPTKSNNVFFSIDHPAAEYPYSCDIYDITDMENGISASFNGTIGNGYVNAEVDISYGDSEVIYAVEEQLRLELLARIEAMLAECGHTLDELFPESVDSETQQLYDALVRYIYDEGVEYPDGNHVGLITDNGNEAYVAEYTPETGEICLVYVTEPIPGGSDIFDTSYREKMIFLPDMFAGTLWWSYSYESEDGTVKINATGTEADEDNYQNLTFEGISEEDAKAMLDTAMENTALYYIYLVFDAATYITYDEVADYVYTNGVPYEGGYDLVKDEGNRGYVAEYDAENDALYFVYVTEPIPGGTDIFDTSYREKAVLMPVPPIGEEYFVYTYVSEDSSVTISAQGYYDGYELSFETVEFNGVSEEEATAKISAAVEEAMGYFYEIATEATV